MKYSVRLKMLGSLAFVIAVVLWAGPRVLATLNPPAPVHFTPLAGPFRNPVGIDFQDTSGDLVATINYPDGGSAGDGNFARIDPVTGIFTAFAPSVFGLDDEIKVAAVHLSSNMGGFVDGDVYAGNGIPGQIMKISADGLTVTNPWVTLPGETAHARGSLFQDRYGTFGGDLIVVTGNEQTGSPAVDGVGKVWRISSAGVPMLIRDFQKHLEGVTTIPNNPARFGPIANRILVGDEDRFFVSGVQRSSANGDGAGCRVLAVAPDGSYITLTTAPTDLNGPIPNYHLPAALCPEDFDVISSGAPFFGVNAGDGRVLTAPASDFASFCGDVLVTNELPSGFADVSAPGVSGLNVLHWNPTTQEFDVTPLSTDLTINQWEHVTFAGGSDCATTVRQPSLLLSKTPDGGTFTQGGQTTFTFFVTNNASGPTAGPATNVQLADNLPGNGGLVWVTATPSQGTCVSPIVGNQLHCSLGDIQPGDEVTVTVKSAASTPAAACQLQDNPLAFATADNSPGATDGGSLTCTPPPPPPPPLVSGDTATIGFWHNKNGQAVISCLNGGSTSTSLGNYLATTYPSLFGAGPGSLGNLAGKTNAEIAAIYLGGTYFGASGQKVNAQIIGVALATYVTSSNLSGSTNCGAKFGFNFSAGGTGTKTYNVGLNGHLLGPGFADNQSYTIFQLLLGANAAKAAGTFNANAWNAVFDGINNSGDIV